MIKRILILLLLPLAVMAAKVEYAHWDSGMTYLSFLEKHGLPSHPLYWDLDNEDRKLTEEIYSGVDYQLLHDDNDEALQQVLIPISDELQLHLYQNKKGEYAFEAIPIIYVTKHQSFTTTIENNPSLAIYRATHSRRAMRAFIGGFRKSVNFSLHVQKGDPIVMIYDQKYRFGKPFSLPRLQLAKVRLHDKWHGIYLGSNERYYDEKGHEVENFLLENPIKGVRISSGFTLRRWHPVLHKYRAHLGIDYAARRGTPIHAAGAGVIIDAHRSLSYGNVMKIRHAGGYVTLYAHQKRFRAGMHRGKRVKKDEIVGYVGTTGLSTGPHLHFGLYKNNRPVNPRSVIHVMTTRLSGKKKRQFNNIVKHYDAEAETILATNKQIERYIDFDPLCYVKHDHFQAEAGSNETL